jgi:hypothetical protein
MDDLNYLFHRQQEERGRADRAVCPQAHDAHSQLAAFYETRIFKVTEGRIPIGAAASRTF